MTTQRRMIAALSWDPRKRMMNANNKTLMNTRETPGIDGEGDKNNEKETINNTEDNNRKQRRQEEQMLSETFSKLGSKLASAYKVVQNAKNIHKSVRDDITCAMALYEQIKDLRENVVDHVIDLAAKEVDVSLTVVTQSTKPGHEGKRSRGSRSNTPDRERHPKKLITVETPRTTETPIVEVELSQVSSDKNEWKKVRHRKQKKSKEKVKLKDKGEALTIKTNTEATYADVLKKMKNNIDPMEMGIDIRTMRRTRTGNILVKFNKGEGQAEKLTRAIERTLGNDVSVKTITKNCVIDIRDMDEATEEDDIISALITTTKLLPTEVKILNIRDSFARTKQALIQVPESIATLLLETKKIRIGWVICRVRKKAKTTQCFRCLDQGHMANTCKGTDRSDVCRKCCNSGHKSKQCKGQTRCAICQEAGMENIQHYIGSIACVKNRREYQRND